MAGENDSISPRSSNPTALPEKALSDPRLKLVRQISKLDCSAVPFSRLEIKVRDDGRPYSVVITRTYMIGPDGDIT